MKTVLGALLILSLCGTGYLFQQQEEARRALADQQAALQAKDKELEQKNRETERQKAELEKAETLLENSKKEIEAARNASNPLKQSLEQLQKEFDAYKIKYRTEARNRAAGEHLEQLATAKGIYQDVTIKSVDPEGIHFVHASGAGWVGFEDLNDEWKTRFQYDPIEAAACHQARAEAQARIDRQLADQLTAQAQNLPKKTQSPPSNQSGPSISQIEGQIQSLQGTLDQMQSQHDAWVSQHHGSRGGSENIPEGISSAAISQVDHQIRTLQFQLQNP